MLMLQVRYTLQEGKDPAAFVHALEQADIPARTRAETGCCQYEFFYSASSPNEVLLLEAWADEIPQGYGPVRRAAEGQGPICGRRVLQAVYGGMNTTYRASPARERSGHRGGKCV